MAVLAIASNNGNAIKITATFPASSTFDAKEDSPASRQASAANYAKKQVPNVLIKIMVYSPDTPEADSISVMLLKAGVKF